MSIESFPFDLINSEDYLLDTIMDDLSSFSESSCFNHLISDHSFPQVSQTFEEDIFPSTSSSEERTTTTILSNEESKNNYNSDNKNNRKKRKLHVNNISKNIKRILVPRILNTDIRKKYPIMINNILNSGNLTYIKQFLYTFTTMHNSSVCWKHCRYIDKKSHSLPQNHNPCCLLGQKSTLLQYEHISELSYFLFLSIVAMPDRVFTMTNCEIFSRSDSFETKITVYFIMTGTKSYETDPYTRGKLVQSYAQSKHSFTSNENNLKDDEEFSLIRLFHQKIARSESPRPMYSEVKVTLTVEDYRKSMKINKIEFESTSNQARYR